MDQATWVTGPAGGRYYGRSTADKDSFDGLPPSAFIGVHPSLLAPDLAEADWELVESLFESNWFGPCSCLGSGWCPSRSNSYEAVPSSYEAEAMEVASASARAAAPRTAAAPRSSCFPSFLTSARRHPEPALPPQLPTQIDELTPPAEAPVLYGAAAAPAPVPPFSALAPKGTSPPKAVPVPRRAPAGAEGDADTNGNTLPPVLIVSETSAAVAVAQPAVLDRPRTAAGVPNGLTPQSSVSGPQLGTWADRQYRLLDSVPERGEYGLASGSGASEPSSSYAARSPVLPSGSAAGTGMARSQGPGQQSSSACGSGSADCTTTGGSDSSAAGRAPNCGSPPLLSSAGQLNGQQQLEQQQQHKAAHVAQVCGGDVGCGNGGCAGAGAAHDAAEQGRRRPGQEALLRSAGALQQHTQDAGAHHSTWHQPPPQQPPVDSEARMQDAAWRWRFTRRWQAEQARTEPERAASLTTDQMEEALAYLAATGATTTSSLSMQIGAAQGGGKGAHRGRAGGGGGGGPGASLEGSLQAQSLVGTLGGGGSTLGGEWQLGAYGSGSGSFTKGPRLLGRQGSGELLAASREVASLNRRAVGVLQQQMDCERQAERRVQESLAQGPQWVGQLVPVVALDEWGSFRFLMLKLRDQGARLAGGPGGERQRILIRGHNYGSEGQLVEECNREILAVSQKHGVPFEAPSVMGGGVMEWRRDRDRHLHLHSGFVMDRALPAAALGMGSGLAGGGGGGAAASGRPASAMDLLNLAAALVRQSFPPTYKVTVLA